MSSVLPGLFQQYELDSAYDEMLAPSREVRPHYRHLYQELLQLPPDEMRRRKQASELSFLHQGITFTVYGRDEGIEKIFPHDLLPRIVTNREWQRLE